MAEIVLELIDGEGDTLTVRCWDNDIVVYEWAYSNHSATVVWSEGRHNKADQCWLKPLIPIIDAAFKELGAKADD